MSYISLYRKYRPLFFKDILGQNETVISLENSLKSNNYSHAYIFSGPRGTGKTSLAKIFARSLNCDNRTNNYEACAKCSPCIENFKQNSLDIIEIDAASNNGVDEIRDLKQKIQVLPNFSKYKVYIIDEVHMLSKSAFNALLKTLEEPPKHIIFILATTEISKLPLTILSRCQRFNFTLLKNEIIIKNLKNILIKEKIVFEIDALEQIASLSFGSLRDSLSILEQIITYNNQKITLENVVKSFKLLNLKEKEAFIDGFLTENKNIILKVKNKIIDNSLDINMFLIEIIQILKTRIEKSIFENNKNNNKLIKFLEIILKYNNYFFNIKDPRLYFELFIIELLKSFISKSLNEGINNNKKEINSVLKNDNHITLEKNNSKKEIIKDIQLEKVDESNLSTKKFKEWFLKENKYHKNKYKLNLKFDYFNALTSSSSKEELVKFKNKIIKLSNKDFLYFYNCKIPCINKNGAIVVFEKEEDANFLNYSLFEEKTRNLIFNKLNLKKYIIIALTYNDFKTALNTKKMFGKIDDFVYDFKKYYDDLYEIDLNLDENKLIDIFGKEMVIE